MANSNRKLEYFQDVFEIVEWVNGGSMEDWSETSGNPIVTKLQKDASFAQVRVERVEEELSELRRDKELLIHKLGQQETEIDKLKKELVREKWETSDAKVNTKEMAKEVSRLYWKIGDLVEKISTGDMGEEGEDIQLVDDEDEGPLRKRNKWDVNGDGGDVASKDNKMGKIEEDRSEPEMEFPMVNMESGSVILDQLRKEEEEASTLTLTFHRSSPSPPNLEYPPQQVEFFHKLLGLPENLPETTPVATASPKLSPIGREFLAFPEASVISVTSPQPQISQIPDTNKANEAEEENKEIYHAADPSKRHLGYFCLCGLECSTKKTLQFHLQYLQSNTSSSSTSSSNGTLVESDTIAQINMIPVHYHPPQHEPRTIMKIKKCKRCGDSYTGGKEGLRQHNLLHHNSSFQQPYPSPPVNDVISHPHTNFPCAYCPEIFRTMVQLRLHHKVKHTPSNNQLNHLSTGYSNE